MKKNIDSDNKLSETSNHDESNLSSPTLNKEADQSKRALTKAALASPVLTSLISHPVWGAGVAACSISGMQSGNASGNNQIPPPCAGSGCTPGYWKTNLESWLINTSYSPGYCSAFGKHNKCAEWSYASGTPFSTAFGVNSKAIAGDTVTLLEVLQHAEYDLSGNVLPGNIHSIEAHFVAALLNATAQPQTYGATAQQVINSVAGVYNGTLTKGDGVTPISIDTLFNTLVRMNEAGDSNHCIFNASGFCDGDAVSNGEECIPACASGWRYDYCEQQCVQMISNSAHETLRLDGKPFVSVEDALNTADPASLCNI